MIAHSQYLNRLIAWREMKIIKVVTGVRRCGKSTLFELYAEHLKSTGVLEEQIISINLEDIAYEDLQVHKTLYTHVKERLCKDKYSYIFLDEIQNCKDFEKSVDSLFI